MSGAHRGKQISNAEFRRLWEDMTISKAEIGRRLGIGIAAVSQRAAARGLPPRPDVRPWQRVHSEAEILELFGIGLSANQIARRMGCTIATVRHTLRKNSIGMRPIRTPAPVRPRDADEAIIAHRMAKTAALERAAVAEHWRAA